MLWVPMVIMLVVTLVALTLTIVSKTQLVVGGTSTNVAGDCLQLVFAVALFVPGVTVAFQGIRKMFQKKLHNLWKKSQLSWGCPKSNECSAHWARRNDCYTKCGGFDKLNHRNANLLNSPIIF